MPDIGWLAIVSEAQRGRTIQLDSVRRTLGSSTAHDLVIPDATIAPVHAEFERCEGGWLLRDLGGGVVANQRQVLTIELVDGDVIEDWTSRGYDGLRTPNRGVLARMPGG